MKKIKFSLLLLGLVALNTFAQSFVDRIDQIKSIRADFVQVDNNATKHNGQQSGNFLIEKPGKFRWSILKPNMQIFVSNTQQFWHYDEELEQVTVQNAQEALSDAPIKLLSSSAKELTAQYKIENIDQNTFKLTPKDSDEASFKAVIFSFKNDLPTEIKIINFANKALDLKLSHVQINQNIKNSQFVFVAPKNVDVLKMD
jgi:outer membrane lipoprotein carrier protein